MVNLTDMENSRGETANDVSCFCLHDNDIFLFPFEKEELYSEEYLRWMNDLEITKTLGRLDYLMPVNRAKLISYFNSINRENTIFLAIYLKKNVPIGDINKLEMKFIGTLKIYDLDLLAKRASIGIAIGEKLEWGKGYAAKAIGIATKYIFDNLGFRKITAGYIADNIGMENAFLKNGFEVEAIFKEHLFYEGRFVDHKYVFKFRK